MSLRILPLEEVRVKGLQTLSRELGPYNLIRFLQQYETGYGDYTKERNTILGKKSVDDIVSIIKQQRNNNKRNK